MINISIDFLHRRRLALGVSCHQEQLDGAIVRLFKHYLWNYVSASSFPGRSLISVYFLTINRRSRKFEKFQLLIFMRSHHTVLRTSHDTFPGNLRPASDWEQHTSSRFWCWLIAFPPWRKIGQRERESPELRTFFIFDDQHPPTSKSEKTRMVELRAAEGVANEFLIIETFFLMEAS